MVNWKKVTDPVTCAGGKSLPEPRAKFLKSGKTSCFQQLTFWCKAQVSRQMKPSMCSLWIPDG